MADAQLMPNLEGYQSFVHQLDARIRRLRLTKEHLESRALNIIHFTTQFCNHNQALGEVITRPVVEFFWTHEIWSLYPENHPEKDRLIGQANSPKYEAYWQKRLDADAFKAKRARQSSAQLWSFPRNPSKEEKKDAGIVLLGNRDWTYSLPEVQLMPLYHVSFLELAKKIIAANPGKPLGIELMRRLWRVLIRDVYDFVDEAERMAKLEEAKAVTDERFEEALRAVPERLSKKRGMSPECDSEAEASTGQRQQSKKKKTVRFAETEGSGSQIGTDGSAFESSTEPKPSAATNGHQPVSEGESLAQDPHTLEQTRRIAKLEASLATAERQVAESQRAKSQADRRWDSQLGQLRAAERDARDLRGANSDVARHMKARNEAEHKMKSQRGELERAKDKIAWLERELRAANGRIARLEAPLEKKDRVSVIARRR